ncbi:hypothetical protein GCM10028772_12920 [Nocardioides ultimimeridianus]
MGVVRKGMGWWREGPGEAEGKVEEGEGAGRRSEAPEHLSCGAPANRLALRTENRLRLRPDDVAHRRGGRLVRLEPQGKGSRNLT